MSVLVNGFYEREHGRSTLMNFSAHPKICWPQEIPKSLKTVRSPSITHGHYLGTGIGNPCSFAPKYLRLPGIGFI